MLSLYQSQVTKHASNLVHRYFNNSLPPDLRQKKLDSEISNIARDIAVYYSKRTDEVQCDIIYKFKVEYAKLEEYYEYYLEAL
jgi:hypothetical protein